MTLAEEYRAQEAWRSWDEALDHLPITAGQTVLDLGCGTGPMSRRLHARGANVVGLDTNDELLAEARTQCPGARFENRDATAVEGPVDGIWAAFLMAYLTSEVVGRWAQCLRPGGFLAMLEMDDLLGHTPLAHDFDRHAFYAEAAGRYDFEAGRKLAPAARAAGLEVLVETTLPDQELSFEGPAHPEVLLAWQKRLARMGGLQSYLGAKFPAYERAFLDSLAAVEHRAECRVVLVVAQLPSDRIRSFVESSQGRIRIAGICSQ